MLQVSLQLGLIHRSHGRKNHRSDIGIPNGGGDGRVDRFGTRFLIHAYNNNVGVGKRAFVHDGAIRSNGSRVTGVRDGERLEFFECGFDNRMDRSGGGSGVFGNGFHAVETTDVVFDRLGRVIEGRDFWEAPSAAEGC